MTERAVKICEKEPLAKQAVLVYSLLKKVIGRHEFRYALSKIDL